MPSLTKQKANRPKVLAKRTLPVGSHHKKKTFNPLSKKIKRNNKLLAKALSLQKQENQLLFTQNLELTSQLQSLGLACNRRDIVLGNIQNNAKEMLTMLVTMTNYVTDTIVSCQEFVSQKKICSQAASTSATKRESTRRLSVKSPARGVVKPMVSGHTITKPTINLRRINMQRLNDMLDLSTIEERTPQRLSNPTSDTSPRPHVRLPNTSRNGYESVRRRRLPERIPLDFIPVDDDEDTRLSQQNSNLSGSSTDRVSDGHIQSQRGNIITGQCGSPRVTLSDVSELLRNSHSINLRMLRESMQKDSPSLTRLSINSPDSKKISTNLQSTSERKISTKKSTTTSISKGLVAGRRRNRSPCPRDDHDPVEGPSWLLDAEPEVSASEGDNQSNVALSQSSETVTTNVNELNSNVTNSDSIADISMEFTECINTNRRPNIPMIIATDGASNDVNGENSDSRAAVRGSPYIRNTSVNQVDNLTECCDKLSINSKKNFVTDRRHQSTIDYEEDEDDDTMMLQFRAPPRMKFNINELRLPVLDEPIRVPSDHDKSEPEVTTTIKIIPPTLTDQLSLEHNVDIRATNFGGPQLPAIDETLTLTKKRSNLKKKQKREHYTKIISFESSSDSESYSPPTPKKTRGRKKSSKVPKNVNCAKVVLKKLDDTDLKYSDTLDSVGSENLTSEYLEQTNVSIISTGSETARPRRQKAPANLKEPKLNSKLRRE